MTDNDRILIPEIIVVEGIHDKQAVLQVADADVWVIGGNRIAHRFLEELQRVSTSRGVLVLTDPDGPGEQIRRRIEQAVPGCRHAFLPKKLATATTGVGVEHASPTDIKMALQQARGSTNRWYNSASGREFTVQDLVDAGLVNHAHAASQRKAVGDALHIGYANAKTFLHKLNALGVTREEWVRALEIARKEGEQRS